MDINEAVRRAHACAVRKGFWTEGKAREFDGLLMLVVSEAAEALERWRKGELVHEYRVIHGDECAKGFVREGAEAHDPTLPAPACGVPDGIPTELADIVIRVFDIAGRYRIDLAAVLEAKMAFNETRPKMHGKVR